jgi:hypothetical protein
MSASNKDGIVLYQRLERTWKQAKQEGREAIAEKIRDVINDVWIDLDNEERAWLNHRSLMGKG